MIKYKISRLTQKSIFNYLSEIDRQLVPKLSARVDIKEYSGKLHNKAIHFCAFDNGNLIGIALCYFNDSDRRHGYISSLSVLESYRNQGIAGNLLKLVIDFALKKGFRKINLRVYFQNLPAKRFYNRFGFEIENMDVSGEFSLMSLNLSGS